MSLPGAVNHDVSVALYTDGKLLAASEEESFLRDKHAKGKMPCEVVKFCLTQANIRPEQVDMVAFPYAQVSLKSPARWRHAKRYWYTPDHVLT